MFVNWPKYSTWYSMFSILLKIVMKIIQKTTWFITLLMITSQIAFIIWLDTWFSITICFWEFLFISFLFQSFHDKIIFSLERQIFILYGKVIIKIERIRQGKSQCKETLNCKYYLSFMLFFFNETDIAIRPGWEKCAIALALTHTCHIKSMSVVYCMPKTLYGAFSICPWTKLKNGQHQHEKLKFDVGLTCLVFSLERNLNIAFFCLKHFNSTFRS